MNRAALLACLGLLISPTVVPADAEGSHPLLDYARERELERDSRGANPYYGVQLTQNQHELERAKPPPDEECARSLGASLFANLHVQVGDAHEGLGNPERALDAYRHALACRPRSLRIHTQIAKALFAAREFDAARAAADEALAIDARDVDVNRLIGNLDFVGERWADAMARFRYVASSDLNPETAAFAQLMFWLAQQRAGIAKPDWVPRRLAEDWPRPLLLYARGEYDEADLLREVRKQEKEAWLGGALDRQLASCLFLVAEARWARGEPDRARLYFAAVVNIKHTRSDEYHLAMSEIAKLNRR